MTAFRLVQISDTHLSRANPYFFANWDAVVAHINALKPDLILNTGDIALNGPDVEDDLAFAAEQHARLAAPLRTIPGNHDLGDNPADPTHPPKQAVTPARLQAYEKRFGLGFWSMNAGPWLLIGMNAQLFDTGLPAEEAQWAFLDNVFADAGARPVAVFLHKPLFKNRPDDTDTAKHRYVPPEPRLRLLGMMQRARVKIVGCGHVHQYRTFKHDGIDHVWCPSTAFILPDDLQPRLGEKRVGFVTYVFENDRLSFGYDRASGMHDTLITDVAAYGDIRQKMRAAGIAPAAA